jgi:hypothetical protein
MLILDLSTASSSDRENLISIAMYSRPSTYKVVETIKILNAKFSKTIRILNSHLQFGNSIC